MTDVTYYHQLKENLEQALEEYRDALPAGQADAAENLYAAARALSDSLNLFGAPEEPNCGITRPHDQHVAEKPEGPCISRSEILRILHEVRDRYARYGRGDDDIFRVLENRLAPLAPGEPVQFLPVLRHGDVDPGKRRWLNGTYDGPVSNPDDPNRSGDIWITRANGHRVTAFLSEVERRA